MIKTSVIISFYNNISILKLVLHALTVQSEKKFEVIIADDGSGRDVVSRIKDFSLNYPFPIKHVWHEDIGFRKTRILNNAILNSSSDYLIFIDGDCIPHHHFIKDHLRFKSPERIVAGRRVNVSLDLKKYFSEDLISKKFPISFFFLLLLDSITGKSRDVEKGIHLPVYKINTWFGSFKKGILGANFSAYKSTLEQINGFNMAYEKPFIGEDTDIEYRLRAIGKEVFSPRFRLIQYHLIHERLNKLTQTENQKILDHTKANNEIFTAQGLTQLKI